MNIAQIICTYPPYKGGMGNSVASFADRLKEFDNRLTIITPNYSGLNSTTEQVADNLKVVRLGTCVKSGNAAFIPQLFFRLKNIELVHYHYPFYGASCAVLLNKFFRKKSKLVVHFHMDNLGTGLKGLIFKLNRIIILPILFKSADLIVCASLDYVKNSSVKNLYEKYILKFKEIPFGVDSNKFLPVETKVSLEKNILFVGGLDKAHYFKGLELLLNAVKALTIDPEITKAGILIKLNIVGKGELKKYYEDLADQLEIRSLVNFADQVDDQELVKYYQAGDLFVLPSINQGEAFGLVLLEAMSSGKPVIASDLPGVRKVFRDGQDGLLFKTNELPGLIDKIKKLLTNANLATSMGRSGRQLVLQKYDWQIVTKLLNEAYESVLKP